MRGNGLIKVFSPKMFKDFKKIIDISWADHICLSRSIGTGHRNNKKIIK